MDEQVEQKKEELKELQLLIKKAQQEHDLETRKANEERKRVEELGKEFYALKDRLSQTEKSLESAKQVLTDVENKAKEIKKSNQDRGKELTQREEQVKEDMRNALKLQESAKSFVANAQVNANKIIEEAQKKAENELKRIEKAKDEVRTIQKQKGVLEGQNKTLAAQIADKEARKKEIDKEIVLCTGILEEKTADIAIASDKVEEYVGQMTMIKNEIVVQHELLGSKVNAVKVVEKDLKKATISLEEKKIEVEAQIARLVAIAEREDALNQRESYVKEKYKQAGINYDY